MDGKKIFKKQELSAKSIIFFSLFFNCFQWIVTSNLIQVDVSKTDQNGRIIFGNLMNQGLVVERKNHPLLRSLMSKIEEIFFFLISKAEEKLTEEEINRIP